MSELRPSRRSDGTLQTQRQRLPWPSDRPFRILSIDGGGIRGILPASVLANFENRLLGGKSCGSYFDLIVGTSTGGIIAIGLAAGLTAQQILQLYVNHGREIFLPIRPPFAWLKKKFRWLRSLRRYQYERDHLEEQLRAIFGHAILGETERRLCIPAFDGFTETFVFKTPHHPDFRVDWKEELTTVALATSSAPSFFAVYRNQERKFADGGVWANNPVMIGLVDTLSCYDVDRRQIEILSLGCGEVQLEISDKQLKRGGLLHWRNIISAAMRLASQNALGQAGLLIGRDKILRIDALPMAEAIELDDFERSIAELPLMATQLAERFEQDVAVRFFFAPSEPYPAFHGPRTGDAQATPAATVSPQPG
jgi:patatin-like phospholipase/acyl hydrolase